MTDEQYDRPVKLELSRREFDELVRVVAFATGIGIELPEHARYIAKAMRSINALNRGNTDYIPYAVDPLPVDERKAEA